MLKRLSGSINAQAKIACVIVSSVLILGMNRVITATHDFPNVVGNTHVKISYTAEIGIFIRSGGAAVAIHQTIADFKGGVRIANEMDISKYPKKLATDVRRRMKFDRVVKNNAIDSLLKRLSGSIIAQAKIACVIVSSVLILGMNRVITATILKVE